MQKLIDGSSCGAAPLWNVIFHLWNKVLMVRHINAPFIGRSDNLWTIWVKEYFIQCHRQQTIHDERHHLSIPNSLRWTQGIRATLAQLIAFAFASAITLSWCLIPNPPHG